jgi:predicted nuclease with TOPRIM domain
MFGVMFLLISCLLAGCGGVSEEAYNAVKAERDAIQAQVTDLQSEVSAMQAEYDGLQADYDELTGELETVQAEHEELSAEYDELNAQYEELSQQLDVPVEEPAEIIEADVEQGLLQLINQARADNDLNELDWGKYLYRDAIANCRDMATSGRIEYPERPCWKDIYRAAGFSTTDEMVNATFTVWEAGRNYEENILDTGPKYGAVAVYKSGEVFYITYMLDYYQ